MFISPITEQNFIAQLKNLTPKQQAGILQSVAALLEVAESLTSGNVKYPILEGLVQGAKVPPYLTKLFGGKLFEIVGAPLNGSINTLLALFSLSNQDYSEFIHSAYFAVVNFAVAKGVLKHSQTGIPYLIGYGFFAASSAAVGSDLNKISSILFLTSAVIISNSDENVKNCAREVLEIFSRGMNGRFDIYNKAPNTTINNKPAAQIRC